MSAFARPDEMAVPLTMARSAEADQVRECVRLAMTLHAEVSEGHEVMHVQRAANLGWSPSAVHTAPITFTSLPAGGNPGGTVRQLPLSVAVPPVAVRLSLRSSAIAERFPVARFGAEPTIRTATEGERLSARIADPSEPSAVASCGVVADLRAVPIGPLRGPGLLDLKGDTAPLTDQGYTRRILPGHRSSLLRCQTPAVVAARGHFASTFYHESGR